MNKLISKIPALVMMINAVFVFASCAAGKIPVITSNWKFDSITAGGKTSGALDFKEDDIPMIVIDCDTLNKASYYVTYRQNGKNHNASMEEQGDGSYRIDFVDSDKDMTARIKDEKLTLTIDGSKDTSIVFRYTDEEILIPADDKEGPDYIKAKMTDFGKVELINEGNNEYQYGRFYRLEVQKNGKWCYVRYNEHYAWTAEGIQLAPGAANTEEYDLSYYGTLKPGEYRLAVGETDACIYAYFTVNADGTFSYTK